MTDNSMINGKAYEYACIVSLEEAAHKHRPVKVIQNSSFGVAKNCWLGFGVEERDRLKKSALAGVEALLTMEPKIIEDGTDMLELSLQADTEGKGGDVRDILVVRRPIKWEIGISVKHNHAAVKHSRLSSNIDFGSRWFGMPCSTSYFEEIAPCFSELNKLKKDKIYWRDIEDKEARFYIPVLKAFVKELQEKYDEFGSEVVQNMMQYLLGKYDFYKLISDTSKRTTRVISFNLYGTLNQASGSSQPETKIPIVPLPTRIFNLGLKPGSLNTVELNMDNGWEISLRIHSARSLVESSLKFDVQLTGMPTCLFTIEQPWESPKRD